MANSQYHRSKHSSYPDMGLTEVLTADDSKQLQVESVSALNGTASPLKVGLFSSIINDHFKVFSLGASDVESTSAIQAGTAISMFTADNNYGTLFQAKEKFNMISFNVSQVETGYPEYTYEYYNGSGWSTLSLLHTPVYLTTGIQAIVFNSPIDWVVGDSTEGGDATLFSIRCLATTAPDQAVQIDSLKLGRMIKYYNSVPAFGSLDVDFESDPYLLQSQESIIPFFSYASASNTISIDYKINS